VIPLIRRITSLEAAMMGRQTGDQAWETRGVEQTGKNFEKINRCSSFSRVGGPRVIFPSPRQALPTHYRICSAFGLVGKRRRR
jgi:hypothetical protein